jgi:hypothetical protein
MLLHCFLYRDDFFLISVLASPRGSRDRAETFDRYCVLSSRPMISCIRPHNLSDASDASDHMHVTVSFEKTFLVEALGLVLGRYIVPLFPHIWDLGGT